MFLQQADTNSKSLLCLHRKAPSATYEAVGDTPPPSGAQQCMIPIFGCPYGSFDFFRAGNPHVPKSTRKEISQFGIPKPLAHCIHNQNKKEAWPENGIIH